MDPRSSTPSQVIYGREFDRRTCKDMTLTTRPADQNPVTAVALDTSSSFFSGDSNGRVLQTSVDGVSKPVAGAQHSGLVVDIVASGESGQFFSAAYDDTVKKLSASSGFE